MVNLSDEEGHMRKIALLAAAAALILGSVAVWAGPVSQKLVHVAYHPISSEAGPIDGVDDYVHGLAKAVPGLVHR
jgi:hypothetical protein